MSGTRNLSRGSTRVDLRGIEEGTHPLVLSGGESLVVDPEQSVTLEDFRFEGELVWSAEDRRVRGSLHGSLVSACDRCLVRFRHDFQVPVEVEVALRAEPGRRAGAAPDKESVASDAREGESPLRVSPEDPELDLAGPFRRAVLLEVPIKNVCREDCAGLCPVCGANRNETSCGCVTDKRDPRWDALRGITFGEGREE
jgi:uncharacterized protein